ncbi:hypothetical protein MtrunA17_Chr8g0367971 [Medicago truncatula]|uniref:Uncharacterized protein n=1 Tax=Medicago truncatula TaxID=3880 RepID=A0A396GSI9_MEDTR|nr:hypothetical protein MtrunA17_Chr8g0367971 [Medicago truncatula]
MRSLVNFFKSSTLYTERNSRDVGEVATHYFESLKSLIINVEMFLGILMSLKGHLKLFCFKRNYLFHSNCLEVLRCFCTWPEEDKLYYLSLIVTSSEDDKTSQTLIMPTWPSESKSFRGFTSSEPGSLESDSF